MGEGACGVMYSARHGCRMVMMDDDMDEHVVDFGAKESKNKYLFIVKRTLESGHDKRDFFLSPIASMYRDVQS